MASALGHVLRHIGICKSASSIAKQHHFQIRIVRIVQPKALQSRLVPLPLCLLLEELNPPQLCRPLQAVLTQRQARVPSHTFQSELASRYAACMLPAASLFEQIFLVQQIQHL